MLGYENNRNAVIDGLRNAKSSVSSVYDANMPKVVSKIDWLEKGSLRCTRKARKIQPNCRNYK